MSKFTVFKQDALGEAVHHYPAEIISRWPEGVLVQAHFTRDDMLFNGMLLKKDDLFIEAYYRNKWYNIYEIHDRDDGNLKGWYCNVAMPAKITRWSLTFRDLALDLLVFADGRQMVLDEDEFSLLDISNEVRANAHRALDELIQLFSSPVGVSLKG